MQAIKSSNKYIVYFTSTSQMFESCNVTVSEWIEKMHTQEAKKVRTRGLFPFV